MDWKDLVSPEEDFEKLLSNNLRAASIWIVSGIREKLDTAQEVAGKGVRRRGLDPSSPGEYPKRVSGRLIRSVSWQFESSLVTMVGTSLGYGAILELTDREFILRFMRENEATIAKIIQTGKP